MFGAGLMGGLIGAGLGGMMFGRGFFGGMHGGFGFLGFLLQMALLFFLGRWLLRKVLGAPVLAGGPAFARSAGPAQARPRSGGIFGGNRVLAIGPADYKAFETLLYAIQAAWTAHDLARLRGLATPEMLGYFADQLADQVSRGVRNQVSEVHLQRGDLSEAWTENGRDFATVAMRFTMVDVTRDRAGHVVDGSADERVTVTEFWTFLRIPGGAWVLSAIQQTS